MKLCKWGGGPLCARFWYIWRSICTLYTVLGGYSPSPPQYRGDSDVQAGAARFGAVQCGTEGGSVGSSWVWCGMGVVWYVRGAWCGVVGGGRKIGLVMWCAVCCVLCCMCVVCCGVCVCVGGWVGGWVEVV